jgi:hypothetical protein
VTPKPPHPSPLRGFSLVELLLSVFILAIGIISVSALFPAGIAQQQQSNDDQLGPVVAESALGLLRSRLAQTDFGTFEEFGIVDLVSQSSGAGSLAYRPAPGDWSWLRPAVITQPVDSLQSELPLVDQVGALDVFSAVAQRPWPRGGNPSGPDSCLCEFPVPTGLSGTALVPDPLDPTPEPARPKVPIFGIPYNLGRGIVAPLVVVTQRERWWPIESSATPSGGIPQYAWECMFRRTGGRVQVGIFVFRIVGGGGSPQPWTAALPQRLVGGASLPRLPAIPFRRVTSQTNATAAIATQGSDAGNQVPVGWQQPLRWGSGNEFSTLNMAVPGPFTTAMLGQGQATQPGALGQGLLPGDFVAGQYPAVQNQWQSPGQWLIDNNGHVHRVMQGRRSSFDATAVRLSAPIPCATSPLVGGDVELPGDTPLGVRTLHYVPSIIDQGAIQLVPVYATVRDL